MMGFLIDGYNTWHSEIIHFCSHNRAFSSSFYSIQLVLERYFSSIFQFFVPFCITFYIYLYIYVCMECMWYRRCYQSVITPFYSKLSFILCLPVFLAPFCGHFYFFCICFISSMSLGYYCSSCCYCSYWRFASLSII